MVRGERGQFYLIAAIVIATVLVGIVTVTNYSKREPDTRLNDLKEELEIESRKVLDHGINDELSQSALYQNIIIFTKDFIDKERRDNNFYFVFGNEDNLTVSGYQESSNLVSLDGTVITTSSGDFTGSINPSGSEAVLSIENNEHTFKINKGENFYFVVSREVGQEEIVVIG